MKKKRKEEEIKELKERREVECAFSLSLSLSLSQTLSLKLYSNIVSFHIPLLPRTRANWLPFDPIASRQGASELLPLVYAPASGRHASIGARWLSRCCTPYLTFGQFRQLLSVTSRNIGN